MPVTWVRMRHIRHGGETDVPARAVERYKHRGWRPVNPSPATKPKNQSRRGQAAEQPSEQQEES